MMMLEASLTRLVDRLLFDRHGTSSPRYSEMAKGVRFPGRGKACLVRKRRTRPIPGGKS